MISLFDLRAALEGAGNRHAVGVLQIAAHRQAARDAGDLRPEGGNQFFQIHRRRLALNVGIGGDDDFLDRPIETRQQGFDVEIIGTDAVQRRQPASEDMIQGGEIFGFFKRDNVAGLLDDADDRPVAGLAGANGARVGFGNIAAGRARADFFLDDQDRFGQFPRLVRAHLKNMEGQPPGGLATDAGQTRQKGDQLSERFR